MRVATFASVDEPIALAGPRKPVKLSDWSFISNFNGFYGS